MQTKRMNVFERRQRLLEILCLRRQDTCDNLAHELNVSYRTIRYDIAVLTCSYPIKTVSGRYGGVRVENWYRINHQNASSRRLSAEQIDFLTQLRNKLEDNDLHQFDGVLTQFAL